MNDTSPLDDAPDELWQPYDGKARLPWYTDDLVPGCPESDDLDIQTAHHEGVKLYAKPDIPAVREHNITALRQWQAEAKRQWQELKASCNITDNKRLAKVCRGDISRLHQMTLRQRRKVRVTTP